ncbi:MAG: ABC transporter permease [Candidatus Aminicenantes bacterium]|nr:ABC transporter permease [Candidatus Aminicenantes bacterium]
MWSNYMKVALRNFRKHIGYSLIKIVGLSVSIACCILILLWVRHELSYDRFLPDSDRIFRVGYYGVVRGNTVHGVQACPTLAPVLNRDFPEVKAATRFRKLGNPVIRYGDKVFSEERWFTGDANFFAVFRLPFLAGNPATALEKPGSLVITRSTAHRYFGDENPMGKTLNSDGRRDWTVTGVVADLPENSHLHFDFITSMNSYRGMGEETTWLSNNYYTYFILRDGVDWKQFEAKLQREELQYTKPQIAEMFGMSWEQARGEGNEYYHFLQPMTGIHLNSHLEHEIEPNGDRLYVIIFVFAALAILILALANFINLSTARSMGRAREVGIRKVLGSTRPGLVRQFLSESVGYAVLAMLLALGAVKIVLPSFRIFTGKNLVLPLGDPAILFPLLAFGVLVGLCAGAYPAFFLSSFRPASVLRSDLGGKRAWLRGALVVFQLVVAISLLVGTSVVRRQVDFIRDQKLAMQRERIVNIHKADDLGRDMRAFKQALLAHPNVTAVTNSDIILGGLVGDGYYQQPEQPDSETRVIHHLFTDADYARVYGLKMVSGKFFPADFVPDQRALVLNESAVKILGLTEPVGKRLVRDRRGEPLPVVGVARDFHFRSIHHAIDPLVINVLGRGAFGGREISVRLKTDNIRESLAFMETTWKRFVDNQAFEYEFFDDYYDSLYRTELRTSGIFAAFSIFALFIAGLGLLGLSSFMAEQRTKEIGIRKVLGATTSGIVRLLLGQFGRWILLATVLAWPLAFLVMHNWLGSFAYHISLSPGVFIPSFVFVILAVLLAAGGQTVKAARANPADSLRYE